MFVGKTVVITGAASGIGRSLTLKFAAKSANVWALDIDEVGLAATAEQAAKFGNGIETRKADVCDYKALAAIRDEAVSKHKRLDIWVNNAGIAGIGDFLETGLAGFNRVLDINLYGVTNGTRLALEAMENAGAGTIVNMASVAGHIAAPYMSAYCASKHAVVGLSRSLQLELRLKSSPVNILTVAPGFVDTAIIAKGERLGYPEWLSFMLSTPDAVAESVLRGIKNKSEEIFPTLNGKVLRRFYKLFPKASVASSRLALSRTVKDAITGSRRTRPE